MTSRSVTHATFTVERVYHATPARVFAAWSDPAAKAQWFSSPEAWEQGDYELDFRIGGSERSSGGPEGGPVFTYECRYRDIVEGERIVYAYDMYRGEDRISVSLGTVELKPEDAGTRLVYTEQGAYLDGLDQPDQRKAGTEELLDALGASLSDEFSPAPRS